MRGRYYKTLPLFILVTVAAYQLRLWQLDALALWFDEGVSITFGIIPLSDLAAVTRLFDDTNPPAYRALLGMLMHFFGVTAFAARYVSVIFGVLSVVTVYAIVRALQFRPRVATAASLMMAFAPVQVFFSREAKAYTLVQFCLLILALLWLRLFPLGKTQSRLPQTGRQRAAVILAIWLPALIAFGSHYLSILMLVTINFWMLGWLINYQHKRPEAAAIPAAALFWVGAQLAAVGAWMPWVLATADRALAGTQSAIEAEGHTGQPLTAFLDDMLTELIAGPTVDLAIGSAFLLVSFMGVSMVQKKGVRWVLGAWLFWPLVLGFAVQRFMPFFFPRFILYLSPGLFIAAVLMLTRDTQPAYRYAQAAFSIGIATLFVAGLAGVYGLPNPQLDLREAVAHLEEHLGPDDALIYSYSWQPGMVEAYLSPTSNRPTYYPSFFDSDQFGAQIDSILTTHDQTWLLTYQIAAETPSNDVGVWLLENAATAGSEWFGENQLTPFLPAAPEPTERDCYTFDDDSISLCAPLVEEPEPGATLLQLHLEWKTSTPIERNLIAFVHLLATDEQVPVAQSDGLPANGLRPTFTWEPDEIIIDRRVFMLPADPGDYLLCAGLYNADSQERVTFDGEGDCAPFGTVTVR